MPDVHLEVETKFDVDAGVELPPLTELVAGTWPSETLDGGSPVVEGQTRLDKLRATYFDTADLRLAAAGLTLRRRTGGADAGWHLKVPVAGPDAGARSEVRVPLGRGAGTVPERLARMVRAQARGAALVPVAQIDTRRTVRRLVDATGGVLVEVADDHVDARRLLPTSGPGQAAGAVTSWREVEVELVDGGRDVLAAVEAGLRERGLRAAAAGSKLARVLGADLAAALDAVGPGRTPEPTPRSSAGAVILDHIGEQVEQVRSQDLPVRLDAPDSVHKMRVATRRLRSALSTFKPLFDSGAVRDLRGELKWLAGELGAARDAEVLRDRLGQAVAAEDPDLLLGPVTQDSGAELDRTYRGAHERVLEFLDGKRYQRLLAGLEALVEQPPLTARAGRAAGKVLPRLVARSYAALSDLVQQAHAAPAGAQREHLLHEARKAAKAARYAGEAVSAVFGTEARAFAAAMEDVQEALGEHQDSVVTRARLRELAAHTSNPATAFTYGRLHALEEMRTQDAEQHFDTAWARASRKSLHRWLR